MVQCVCVSWLFFTNLDPELKIVFPGEKLKFKQISPKCVLLLSKFFVLLYLSIKMNVLSFGRGKSANLYARIFYTFF